MVAKGTVMADGFLSVFPFVSSKAYIFVAIGRISSVEADAERNHHWAFIHSF
jgi:hypothetical protein